MRERRTKFNRHQAAGAADRDPGTFYAAEEKKSTCRQPSDKRTRCSGLILRKMGRFFSASCVGIRFARRCCPHPQLTRLQYKLAGHFAMVIGPRCYSARSTFTQNRPAPSKDLSKEGKNDDEMIRKRCIWRSPGQTTKVTFG